MSQASFFFNPENLENLNKFPQSSNEWKSSVDSISADIKAAESALRSQFVHGDNVEVRLDGGTFVLRPFGGAELPRLCFTKVDSTDSRPMIELPLADRIEAYRLLPGLFDYLQKSEAVKIADEKAKNVPTKTVMEIVKDAFESVKTRSFAGPNLVRIKEQLVRLRNEAPKDDSDFKKKAQWFRQVAELLMTSDIFRQIFEQVKSQIPQVWSQLSFKQKLKVGAMAPIIGAGAYLGGIGIAGGGSAVGVPVVLVILLLLFLTHGLVDFLDYVISQLSIIIQDQPSPEAVGKVFEEVLNATIRAIFGKDHDIGLAQKVEGVTADQSMDPRKFELLAASILAKKYGGIGYVTQYSSDGGIDGYIVCESRKEVLLIQAKHYAGKVGYPELTQCLGTVTYWKKALESKFPYPISKMLVASSTDFSIEAKKVAATFPDLIVLESIKP
jgi:hypothetical protein